MSQEGSIKIRTLPRSGETKKGKPAAPPRWIIYVGTGSLVLLIGTLSFPNLINPRSTKTVSAEKRAPAAPTATRSYDSVNRHLQETAAKAEMMAQVRELEYLHAQTANIEVPDESYSPDNDTEHLGHGVTFDQDNSAERVYADLNEDASAGYADSLPGDRISARLANRRWLNELERAERIQFVRNYIRAAAERGYEVQIDQNLVVVGVKKINKVQRVSIDSVLNKLAQQGK